MAIGRAARARSPAPAAAFVRPENEAGDEATSLMDIAAKLAAHPGRGRR